MTHATSTEDRLRQENERLRRELHKLELCKQQGESRGLAADVDASRKTRIAGQADAAEAARFASLQEEIEALRTQRDGYHRAFEEAQKKLSRLRELYTAHVLPKLHEHAAATATAAASSQSASQPQPRSAAAAAAASSNSNHHAATTSPAHPRGSRSAATATVAPPRKTPGGSRRSSK
eukprot:Rhum_TRINITY_DN14889_c24_g1::Rhum_TRINITY_DN14889_c24_g1_i1::g.126504::m.126504